MDHLPHRFVSVTSAERSILECFQKVVASLPDKTALVGETWQPTYAQLDAQSCRVGHALLQTGLKRGDRAAILMQHDAPQIAAVLGVLKAGGIVVVMNPTDPPARLGQILADASPEVLLVDAPHHSLAESTGYLPSRILIYDEALDGFAGEDPGVHTDANEVAFLVYTSGSTGTPKGVMQTHAGIVDNVYRFVCGLGLREEDRLALLASLSGGQGVATACTALLGGATLLPFPTMERGVTGLARWLTENRVSYYISAASLFRHFMLTLPEGEFLPTIRLVRLGSEHAVKEDYLSFLKHFPPSCRFVLTLSSSETGNITQGFLEPEVPLAEGRLPVGRPAPGVEVSLMDEHGDITPPGEKGELVVRSRYLARGYWGNEELTRQRFQEDPTEPGMRLFHSGDLGSWNPDGSLMMAGRSDARVKIRGYRIELSEVEAAVASHPEVREVAVGVTKSGAGEEKLTAYVIPKTMDGLDARQLRAALRKVLPSHMVPAAFVFLETFPHTPHGKLDRQALAAMGAGQEKPGSTEHPMDGTEAVLARIWAEAFDLSEVGATEDFFDLGGDSLIAAVVAARIEATLGVTFDLAAFASHPTIRQMGVEADSQLAVAGTGKADSDLPPLVRADRSGPLPLSFGQERTWRYSQTPEASASYSVTRLEKILGPLDIPALKRSIEEVVRRHETLRTTFTMGSHGPAQVVHAASPLDLPFTDLTTEPDVEHAVSALSAQEMRLPFDLGIGPLFRLHLLKISRDEHLLLRVNHHIISDAWSWKIFLQEVMEYYEALSRSLPLPALGELPVQYADFAVWQRRCLHEHAEARHGQVTWWKSYLDGAPETLNLPLRRAMPVPDAAPSEGIITCGFPPGNAERLDQLAREERATGFMIRLAAFAAQISFEADQPDFLMGIHVTNRQRVELQKMFGFFANLVTLRVQYDPNQSLRQWLSKVRQMVMEVQTRADLPFDLLMEDLQALGVPPRGLHAIFGLSDQMVPVVGSSIRITTLPRRYAAMPWGLTLSIDRWNEKQGCRLLCDARIYKPSRARNMLERYVLFLQEIASHPDAPLWDLYEKVTLSIPVPEDDSELPW